MPSPLMDPALLAFAGNLLSGGQQGGIGFGQSLGGALSGLAQSRLHQQDVARQREQDLLASAERSINLRAALGELQQRQAAAEAHEAFVGSFEPGSQEALAADVAPGQAAQGILAAQQPVTPFQQAQLDQGQQALDLDQQETLARIGQIESSILTSGRPKATDIAGLRKEFSGSSKNFGSVRDGYKRVLATNDDPAGDVSLVFGFMKILDPGSVVREGEFATAENTTGAAGRIANVYNKILRGDRLNPQQRQQFREQAAALYQEQFETQQSLATGFTQIAERTGINPDDILQAVPMPSPQDLAGEAFDTRINAVGADLSTIDQAAQEASQASGSVVTPEMILQALERKKRGF